MVIFKLKSLPVRGKEQFLTKTLRIQEQILDSMPQNEHFYYIRMSFACLPKAVVCALIEFFDGRRHVSVYLR